MSRATFSANLCVPALQPINAESAIRVLAQHLHGAGHVLASYEAAAVLRERKSPTGLPFAGCGVAIPHADPSHVVKPAIAIASLSTRVRFRQMGTPATQIDVSLVVMPAFSAKEQAATSLTRLIELLQDVALQEELLAAKTGEAMCAAITRRWDAK